MNKVVDVVTSYFNIEKYIFNVTRLLVLRIWTKVDKIDI